MQHAPPTLHLALSQHAPPTSHLTSCNLQPAPLSSNLALPQPLPNFTSQTTTCTSRPATSRKNPPRHAPFGKGDTPPKEGNNLLSKQISALNTNTLVSPSFLLFQSLPTKTLHPALCTPHSAPNIPHPHQLSHNIQPHAKPTTSHSRRILKLKTLT